MNIGMLLDAIASVIPQQPAVTVAEQSLAYEELFASASDVASVLTAIGPDGTAAYIGENSLFSAAFLFGAAMAGWCYAPLNYRLGAEELTSLVVELDPTIVAAPSDKLARLGSGDWQLWELTGDIVADTARQSQAESATDTGSGAEQPAILLYTSGTTGKPKPVPLRHGNLVTYVMNTVELASAAPSEAALLSAPPYHIAGVANLLTSVYRGRRTILLPQFSAPEWLEVSRHEHATHAMLVPTMLVRILAEVERTGEPFPSEMRDIALGGAKVSPSLLRRAATQLPAVGFVVAYGLTETSSTVCVLRPEDVRQAVTGDRESLLSSVGRPIPGIELKIVGEGAEAADGSVGEICLRGPQIGNGDAAGERIDGEGWLHTRDLGYRDADGFVYVLGRADDVIIRGGENIMPSEVERVLESHPVVTEAVVVGVPDDEWGEALEAMVVVKERTEEGELREHVHQHLAGYKVPRRIVSADELPHNSAGKVVRREVIQALLADSLRREGETNG
jgi:acyl-CoA synthetase (AMP-forming)/AMP-acid ligase II